MASKTERQINALQTFTIDLIHKSHNAPISQPTMHHSEQKCNVYMFVLNDALWVMEHVHCGICEIGLWLYHRFYIGLHLSKNIEKKQRIDSYGYVVIKVEKNINKLF